MKLYELAANYQNLWDLVDDEAMDLTVIETALTTVEDAIQIKVENVGKFILSVEQDIKAIKSEEERLNNKRKVLENKLKWLKQYIQTQLEITGIEKIKTPALNITLQNNPPSVIIENEKDIPPEFITIIKSISIDKSRIKEALKNGRTVLGAKLEQKKRLVIK